MTVFSPDRLPHVPGYELAAPTDSDVRAMLERVFGAPRAEALWLEACRGAQLDPARVDTLPRLQRVSAALASAGGAASTVARSLDIRIRTYTRLAARGEAAQGARS